MNTKRATILTVGIIEVVALLFLGRQTTYADADLPVPCYWQADASWCWAASACMLARYYTLDQSSGFQAKPWNGAAILKKDKYDGGNQFDIEALLSVMAPTNSFNWRFVSFEWELKSVLTDLLDKGHPVLYKNLSGIDHAFVVTGYSGKDNTTGRVFVNDPSGAIFYGANGLSHASYTWNDFFAKVTWWGFDGIVLYEASASGVPAGGHATIDSSRIIVGRG